MEKLNKKVNIILSVWIALLFIWIGGVSYITSKANDRMQDSIYYYKVLDCNTRSLHQINDTIYLK